MLSALLGRSQILVRKVRRKPVALTDTGWYSSADRLQSVTPLHLPRHSVESLVVSTPSKQSGGRSALSQPEVPVLRGAPSRARVLLQHQTAFASQSPHKSLNHGLDELNPDSAQPLTDKPLVKPSVIVTAPSDSSLSLPAGESVVTPPISRTPIKSRAFARLGNLWQQTTDRTYLPPPITSPSNVPPWSPKSFPDTNLFSRLPSTSQRAPTHSIFCRIASRIVRRQPPAHHIAKEEFEHSNTVRSSQRIMWLS